MTTPNFATNSITHDGITHPTSPIMGNTNSYMTWPPVAINPEQENILIVCVGSDDRPASEDDIKAVEKKVKAALKGTKTRCLVLHHAINVTMLKLELRKI